MRDEPREQRKRALVDPANHGLASAVPPTRHTRAFTTPRAEPQPWSAAAIPAQPTRLIGRAHEVQVVCEQLRRPDVRLLTLTGVAGTGKTRLALEVAAKLASEFARGVCVVSLAVLSDPGLVTSEIARALGIRYPPHRSALESLKVALHDSELLLMLDNFEQVVNAAPRIADLLVACSGLKVLATSRASLRIRWEHEQPVLPLALPNMRRLPAAEAVGHIPAVALFLDRAQAIQPDFAVTADNVAAIAEICVRLDGLPLGIELAAARTKLLSPQAILGRLERRFELLKGDAQDFPRRHQTLRNAIDWSYDLLPEPERRLFRWLAVFVGGCTLEAVERLFPDPGVAALESLTSLIDKSLLRQDRDRDRGGEPRVGMLETLREYGLDQLEARGELAAVRRQHCLAYLALAETAEACLAGPEQQTWLERLEREHDNLRAALRWCIQAGEPELGARLGGALWRFWSVRGYVLEGRAWLTELRALATPSARSPAQAMILAGSGRLAFYQGDYAAARALHTENRALCQELGDRRGEALALGDLADIAHQQGDYPSAQALHEASLQQLRAVGDQHDVGQALNKLGLTLRCLGDYLGARRLYQEALAISQASGDRGWEALVLNNLGRTAYYEGDYGSARTLHEQSLTLRRALGDRRGIAMSLGDLGDTAQRQGDYTAARTLREESLVVWQQLQDRWGLAYVLEGFAELALVRGQTGLAVRLVGAASAMRAALTAPRSPASQQRLDELIAVARRSLGEEPFSQALRDGQAMTADDAIKRALAADDVTQATRDVPVSPASHRELQRLSPREREVAALVARGHTNRHIAERLVIGERTVDTHVANILAKLDLVSRTQIAVWGVEHGLIGITGTG